MCVEICTWCTESIVRALLAAIGNLTESTKGGRLFWDTFCHMHIIHGCVSLFSLPSGLFTCAQVERVMFSHWQRTSPPRASTRFTARQDLWVLVGSAGNRIRFNLVSTLRCIYECVRHDLFQPRQLVSLHMRFCQSICLNTPP